MDMDKQRRPWASDRKLRIGAKREDEIKQKGGEGTSEYILTFSELCLGTALSSGVKRKRSDSSYSFIHSFDRIGSRLCGRHSRKQMNEKQSLPSSRL